MRMKTYPEQQGFRALELKMDVVDGLKQKLDAVGTEALNHNQEPGEGDLVHCRWRTSNPTASGVLTRYSCRRLEMGGLHRDRTLNVVKVGKKARSRSGFQSA